MTLRPLTLNPKLRRIPERSEMTLCIAAFANEWEKSNSKMSAFFCSDARIETSATSSETEFKFRKLGEQWVGMFAGTVSRAYELMDLYTAHFNTTPSNALTVVNDLRDPPQQMKKRLANEYVSSVTGLSFDDFIGRAQTVVPANLYERIWNDIARIELGCQLILVPTVSWDAAYTVDFDGSISSHSNFCAIGTGASNAEAWLHYREQKRFTSPKQTAIHLLEAKRFAENAPGVGKKTHLAMLDSKLLYHQFISADKTEKLAWAKYGPRPTSKPLVEVEPDDKPTPWDELGIG